MRRYRSLLLVVLVALNVGLVGCLSRPETPPPARSATADATAASTRVLATATEVPTADNPTATSPRILATATEQPAPTATIGRPLRAFEEAGCDFRVPDQYEMTCGYLTVPENRQKDARGQQTRNIRLHVALIRHQATVAAPDPIVYLSGGPGSSALASAGALAPLFDAISAERDLILFDQRGIGASKPSLDCPEHLQAMMLIWQSNATVEQGFDLERGALLNCRDRLLAEGVDLAGYTTAANAADVDDLMRALGYDEWNIVGGSYGARLGLTVLRDFGQEGHIRSAILDSVFPHQANIAVETMPAVTLALQHVFERCAADIACAAEYPELERRFDELLERLDELPIDVDVRNPFNDRLQVYSVDDDQLILIMEDTLLHQRLIHKIPSAIDSALGDSPFDFNLLASEYAQQSVEEFALRNFSEGMHYSVLCAEEFPYVDMPPIVAPFPALPPSYSDNAAARLKAFEELCHDWGVPPADPIENTVVTSQVPVLILAGAYDPRTPPAWSQASVRTLANGFYLEHPAASHGVLSVDACTMQVARRFLVNPTADPLTDCVDDLQEVSFE